MIQVEVGIREASQFYRGIPPTDAKSMIQKACNSKSYSIARHLFGHFIYNKVKAPSTSSRGKRQAVTASAVKSSIAEIKAILSGEFKRMLELHGGVTLIFAIDTTGCMHDEINSAKKIARYIIDNVPKSVDTRMEVEYVLAPFNDPSVSGTLPANAHDNPNYFQKTHKDGFLAELDNLPVVAGGDCKELLYKGISDVWTVPHRDGSPIFVFADAGVKIKELDKDTIIDDANMKSMPIYFFLSSRGCISQDDKKLYEEIADATGGQVMYFKYNSFLDELGRYTEKSLIGGSEVPVLLETASVSASRREYSIVADDNMEILNIAATLYSGTADVKLYRPDGSIHDVDKTDTGKGSLYMINNPVPGKWKLATSTDDYYLTGKTTAKDEISFRCYFPFTTKLGRKTFNVTIRNPVVGIKTNMTCQIQAHKKIQTSPLKIQIVTKDLRSVFFAVDLEQVGSTGSLFQAEMTPPSSEFRLILEGKTKKDIAFKRKSSSIFKPTKAYMYPYALRYGYVASKTKSNLISFAVANYGSSEWFDIKVIEAKKFTVYFHDKVFAMKGRTALFRVSFKAPSDAISGRMHHLAVRIVGRDSGSKASHSVQLAIE